MVFVVYMTVVVEAIKMHILHVVEKQQLRKQLSEKFYLNKLFL